MRRYLTISLALFLAMLWLGPNPTMAGLEDRQSGITLKAAPNNYVEIPEITAPDGSPAANMGWLYTKDSGGVSVLYFEDEAGTVTDLSAAGSVTYDAIGDAAAGGTILFGAGEEAILSSAVVGEPAFEFRGTGNVGNFPIVKISQLTGNPTDGTALEVLSQDSDMDALLVTANASNAIQVTGAGLLNLVGLTGTIDYTDFDVDADGALTLACDVSATMITLTPSAGAVGIDASNATITTALSVGANDIVGTTGLINYTNFDVDASGNVVSLGNITGVDGVFSGNLSVTGAFQQDSIVAKTAATTLTVDGTGVGGVTVGGTSTGAVTLGGGATQVTLPSTVDLVLSGGDITATDTANADMVNFTNNTMTTADLVVLSAAGTRTSDNVVEITDGATTGDTIGITANAQTSGYGITYSNSGAALTGAGINLAITDGAGFTGSYVRCYDGAAEDFTVKRYGATAIAGNASTDVLTLTAGDLQITSGDIDLDNGQLMVDTTQDLANNISRNFAGAGTGPTLSVVETHASSTNSALTVSSAGTAGTALKVDQTGTGNAIGVDLNVAGDLPAIDIDASAARDGDVIDILMTNMLDERALKVTGAITGTAGEGVIEVQTTGQIAATASLLRLDMDTAQAADGSDGFAINVDDNTLVATTPSVYAVLIDSAANEALHVATGKALFDELATFTTGLQANNAILFDSATNDIGPLFESTATANTAGAGVLTVHGDHAGNTNDAALLRLAYQANGDAQDTFILCEDNSTGAIGNGDDKFKVGTNGDTTIGGRVSTSVDARTIATTGDGNPGALTLAPLSSYVRVTCEDADTCDVTMDETGATDGQRVTVTCINTLGTCDFADSAGVSELAGNYLMDDYDSLNLIYASDRWVEENRSNN